MATSAKITVSPEELQLVTDTRWILTKHNIIGKVYVLLGELSEKLKPLVKAGSGWLPPEVAGTSPKIYKGENYRLLPYVMLDYPRFFSGADAFSVRTMFWWGNFFSITLHLGGRYKIMFEERIMERLALLQQTGFFIGINEDQWQHHFESDNYVPAAAMDPEKMAQLTGSRQFIKLSVPFSLHQWNEMPELLEISFKSILQLLQP